MTRRRLALAALCTAVCMTVAACGSANTGSASAGTKPSGDTSAGGTKPALGIGYFQGSVAGPEAIIAANDELSSKIPATITLFPVDSGVAGLAQLKGGAFAAFSGVGNPPTVAAIGNGVPISVVYVESIDLAGLLVNDTIKTPQDLAGKEVGALVGSTYDFQLRGWLASQGLTDKVTVRAFQKEPDIVAAYKTGSLPAAYLGQGNLLDAKAKGGTVLVTAGEIAKLGYAALGLLVVTKDFIAKNPNVVQALVCQTIRAQELAPKAEGAEYVKKAAGSLGVKPELAVEGTKDYPYIPVSDELAWFQGPDGKVASGRLVDNFTKVGQFLVTQQRLTAVPPTETLVDHIDPTFATKAINDKACA